MMEKAQNVLKNRKYFFAGKLSLYNMTASSSLLENVYQSKFFIQMFIFIILLTMSSVDFKCLSADGDNLRYRCYDHM